jgi:hypothetical protein
MNFDPEDFGRKMAAVVRDHVAGAIAPLSKRIEELEAGAMRYQGTHQRALSYRRGDCVTQGGSLWIAIMPAKEGEVPGKSDCWQLATKSGGSNAR